MMRGHSKNSLYDCNVERAQIRLDNAEIGALSAQQQQTSAQVDMLAGQNLKILKLLQVPQDRISFP